MLRYDSAMQMEQKVKVPRVKGKDTTAIHLGSVGKATEETLGHSL